MDNVSDQIAELSKKIDDLKTDIQRDDLSINAHPVLFIILLVLFFVTMDLWAIAIHETIKYIHPTGNLSIWEYILVAIIALVILLVVAKSAGIRIRSLEK